MGPPCYVIASNSAFICALIVSKLKTASITEKESRQFRFIKSLTKSTIYFKMVLTLRL